MKATVRLQQLVYTSLPTSGFRLVTSDDVPRAVQKSFIEGVVRRHWDPYAPTTPGSRAVYVHQADLENTLFGWLYEDGLDEFGRGHVPYFVCYYLTGPLGPVQLENIFTCLQHGPVDLAARSQFPDCLEMLAAPDLWSYSPARRGVRVPLEVRQQCQVGLETGTRLHLFVPEQALHPAPATEPPAPQDGSIRATGFFSGRKKRIVALVVAACLIPSTAAVMLAMRLGESQRKLSLARLQLETRPPASPPTARKLLQPSQANQGQKPATLLPITPAPVPVARRSSQPLAVVRTVEPLARPQPRPAKPLSPAKQPVAQQNVALVDTTRRTRPSQNALLPPLPNEIAASRPDLYTSPTSQGNAPGLQAPPPDWDEPAWMGASPPPPQWNQQSASWRRRVESERLVRQSRSYGKLKGKSARDKD